MGNFAPSSARRDKPICNEPASQNLFFRCPPSTTDSPESSSLPSREVRTKKITFATSSGASVLLGEGIRPSVPRYSLRNIVEDR